MDIKISELATYLNISRPTLYRYIELYDSGHTKEINRQVLKLFKFIEKNKFASKNKVIKYILNDFDANERTSKDKEEIIAIVNEMNTKQAKELLKLLKGEL
ncbi:hypothetical protein [Mesoplasma lactucae]|uniref:Uncharacterized protein n=2 Tax=Mesoplasma lactucae TaxID=138853 RepID=A0A291IQU3_9MOLU|nr:hypothetical protein CP520_00055 [Mesoplasma lactucae ATCC 49193]